MAPVLAALPAMVGSLGAIGGTAAAGTAAAGAGAAAGGLSLGSVLSAVGTGLSAAGTIYGGIRAKQNANFEANSMKSKGDADYAIAERKAIETKRQTDLVTSRERAIAGASGGAVTDPSVVSIMGKTQAQGDYNALIDMYNGISSRADLYAQADSTKAEGDSALTGSLIGAGTTVANGAAGIYSNLTRRRNLAAEYSYSGP